METEKCEQISVSGQAKSYTCSFCKKGFSNAQALGGHMNIHRKDRAKLRESSEEENNMLSSDINHVKTSTNLTTQVSDIIVLESSTEEKSSTCKTPSKTRKFSKEDRHHDHGESDTVQGSSTSKIEVDLELRLGPEPHQNQTGRKSISTQLFYNKFDDDA